MSQPVLEPQLSAHPLLQASDRDTLVQALGAAYGVRHVEFGKTDAPFRAIANRVQLQSVTLHYCSYETSIQIDFGEMPGFRQLFHLSGAGEIRVGGRAAQITSDSAGVVSPGSDFSASYGDGYSHLVVQIAEDEIRRKAELLLGHPLPPASYGRSVQSVGGGGLDRLKAIALALAFQFANEEGGADMVKLALEQALISAFLFENRTTFVGAGEHRPRLAGRGEVSRLEDYIQANWDRPLQIEDVAEACGVSVRSVFERFKRSRSVSPHTYLRNVRLDNARRLLLDGQSQLSVIDVALRCGFASLGHFARRYRERFGELPSATLSRRP